MKKTAVVAIVLIAMVVLGGCASILKSMGGLSKTEFEAREAALNEKLATVTASTEQLAAQVSQFKSSSEELEKAKATLENLTAKLDSMSDETLLKLAKLIQDALKTAEAK